MVDPLNPSPALLQTNLLESEHLPISEEVFEDILRAPGVRVERIVSFGQTTPVDEPYVQAWDEWVLILSGTAAIELERKVIHRLNPGDHLHIPANQPHRVVHTDRPTVWLAVHIGER